MVPHSPNFLSIVLYSFLKEGHLSCVSFRSYKTLSAPGWHIKQKSHIVSVLLEGSQGRWHIEKQHAFQ